MKRGTVSSHHRTDVGPPRDEGELELLLTTPSPRLIQDVASIDGDILVLGAGGKMGPSLCGLAAQAMRAAGTQSRVVAVSRFSDAAVRGDLESRGVRTVVADLLDDEQLSGLPDAPNIIYMAGRKFGTLGQEHHTWAMNAYVPARVGRRYRHARIVVFSSGNLYPFVDPGSGGVTEATAPAPVGEYAQSCLARERAFEHVSSVHGTHVAIFRLNYAVDMRYGVLSDIGRTLMRREPVSLAVPAFNAVWQGDANEYAIRALGYCASPPTVLNATGPETISVRWAAERLAERLGVEPEFVDAGPQTALVANASVIHSLLGYPLVTLHQMIDWTAAWLAAGGPLWDRPTKFHIRNGGY